MDNKQDKDIENLLKSAQQEDGLETNSEFDKFLRLNGYSADDLSQRLVTEEVFTFYSEYYYKLYKVIPHRKKFAHYSNVIKKYRTRFWLQGKLQWGLKCSVAFYESYEKFIESTSWPKKLKDIQNAKRSHAVRKQNRKEERQLEKLLSIRDLQKDSSQK